MGDTDALLTALTDKVTEEQTAPIGTSADQINAAFNMAIKTYQVILLSEDGVWCDGDNNRGVIGVDMVVPLEEVIQIMLNER